MRHTSNSDNFDTGGSPERIANKPLYLDEFIAFSPFDRLALAGLIRGAARPGCRMAEIGSWLGNGSTQVFLSELRAYPDSAVLCVDTWQGSPNVNRHQNIASNYDVFGTFRVNVDRMRSSIKLHALMSPSAEAASFIADGAFDLVFIDADHSYQSVRTDIASWRATVRPGGILCGDDCEARLTPENRSRIEANRDLDAIAGEGTNFAAVHPGSILAVHEAFQGMASLYAERPLTLPDGTSGLSTIWFIRI